jgi:hypothetical protein
LKLFRVGMTLTPERTWKSIIALPRRRDVVARLQVHRRHGEAIERHEFGPGVELSETAAHFRTLWKQRYESKRDVKPS